MPEQVIVLSGPVAAGKSQLAKLLKERFDARLFKTNRLIQQLKPRTRNDRAALQRAGASLDRSTKGQWVVSALQTRLDEDGDCELLVIDSVREVSQLDGLRRAFGPRVVHIHLVAPKDELERRYKRRRGSIRELDSYRDVANDPVEKRVARLELKADVRIWTDRCTKQDVLVRAAAHVGLLARSDNQVVDVLVGGQFGSEGKGHIVSHLASEYDYLLRVGGPNAGHKVFEGGTSFTFHQLPSGSRCSEAKLLIGPGAVLNVDKLLEEIAECKIEYGRLSIDPLAMTICAADIRYERKLTKSIGSTGQGVGAATARRILRRGSRELTLAQDVPDLERYIKPTLDVLEDAIGRRMKVLVEGTQGTGLSLYHGYYPYVTSRDTTVVGSQNLVVE